ncbi:cytochrome P450 [Streptomyces massasporeus]|uniref:cytochrome P450 n=1 Tax=Streptomyces massasporeus TaxID=67324 RepID=UPI0033CAA267
MSWRLSGGRLLTAQAQHTDQDLDELLANCALFLIAGHETTTHFIGNATLALLRHPHAADRLCTRPELMPAAVEELLRYDAPVRQLLRRARHDFELAGRTIAAGQTVLLVCGAANRDPAAFPDPHVLDERTGTRHIAFGHGPHLPRRGAGPARRRGRARRTAHPVLSAFVSTGLNRSGSAVSTSVASRAWTSASPRQVDERSTGRRTGPPRRLRTP